MHVLVIPSWFSQYQGDPSGSFFATQAAGVQEAGVQVGIIFPDLRPVFKAHKYLPARTEWSKQGGLNVLRHTYVNWFPRIERGILPRWTAVGLQLFDEYCAKFGKPDLIHAHCLLRAGVAADRIYQEHGVPYVVTEHSSMWHKHEVTPYEFAPAQSAARNAKALISVSGALLSHLRQDLELGRTYVLPNAVDPVFLRQAVHDRPAKDELTFINVALLNPGKRHDILIDAFRDAFGKDTKHKLYIVGDGPQRQSIEARIAEYGMGASIRLLGLQPKEKVATLLAGADCFVLTSDHETFGVVCIEASASGLPVVSTKCGGTDDIVTPDNGLFAEAGSVGSVANALTAMRDQIGKGFYESKRIRDGCIERFSQQSVCSRLVKIYEDVLI